MSVAIEQQVGRAMDEMSVDEFRDAYQILMRANNLTPNQALGLVVAQHHDSRNNYAKTLIELDAMTMDRDVWKDRAWSVNMRFAFAVGIAGLLLIRVSYLSHWFN